MENKGQITVGLIMIVFISVLVGLILFTAIAQQVGTVTNTDNLVNYTATAAANGEAFYLTDYKSISVDSITNGTTGIAIAAGNYTIENNVVYNGAEAVKITVNAETFQSLTWAINGEAQPLTYVSGAGARSMASLIVVFFALAVLAAAMYPIYGSKLLEMFGK